MKKYYMRIMVGIMLAVIGGAAYKNIDVQIGRVQIINNNSTLSGNAVNGDIHENNVQQTYNSQGGHQDIVQNGQQYNSQGGPQYNSQGGQQNIDLNGKQDNYQGGQQTIFNGPVQINGDEKPSKVSDTLAAKPQRGMPFFNTWGEVLGAIMTFLGLIMTISGFVTIYRNQHLSRNPSK